MCSLLRECTSLIKLSIDFDVVNMLTWRPSGIPRSVRLNFIHEIPHITLLYEIRGLKDIKIAWKSYPGLQGMEEWAKTLIAYWRIPREADPAIPEAVETGAEVITDEEWNSVHWRAKT